MENEDKDDDGDTGDRAIRVTYSAMASAVRSVFGADDGKCSLTAEGASVFLRL